MATLTDLQRIADLQFSDIVQTTFLMDHKLRIILEDHGFVDVHLSRKLSNKFSYHWETQDRESTIYRYDNFPDRNWDHLSNYPFHFHRVTQNNVEDPPFPLVAVEGFIARCHPRIPTHG